MVDKITLPLGPDPIRVEPPKPTPARPSASSTGGPDFAELLQREIVLGAVRFSNHAEARLRTREIELSQAQRQRLDQAVEAAERKGARESLVLVDDLALVVNIHERTVITALGAGDRKPVVFTHIDSAVVA